MCSHSQRQCYLLGGRLARKLWLLGLLLGSVYATCIDSEWWCSRYCRSRPFNMRPVNFGLRDVLGGMAMGKPECPRRPFRRISIGVDRFIGLRCLHKHSNGQCNRVLLGWSVRYWPQSSATPRLNGSCTSPTAPSVQHRFIGVAPSVSTSQPDVISLSLTHTCPHNAVYSRQRSVLGGAGDNLAGP